MTNGGLEADLPAKKLTIVQWYSVAYSSTNIPGRNKPEFEHTNMETVKNAKPYFKSLSYQMRFLN